MTRLILFILINSCLLFAFPFESLAQGKIERSKSVSPTKTPSASRKAPVPTDAKYAGRKNDVNAKSVTLQPQQDTPKNEFKFVVTDALFQNLDVEGHVIEPYGSKLHSQELMFLGVTIEYSCENPEGSSDIQMDIKILRESGELIRLLTSTQEYTSSKTFSPTSGSNVRKLMTSIGSTKRGGLKPGVYTFEFWADGKQLYDKKVRIYSGSIPVVENPFFKVITATGCAVNERGEPYRLEPDDFYSDEVKYMSTRIIYESLFDTPQVVTIYTRVFNSDGTLLQGSNPVEGFSNKETFTIEPGIGAIFFEEIGWCDTGGFYPGETRFEYWIDDQKVLERHINIKETRRTK